MYIESKSAKIFLVILSILTISVIGFMIHESFDNIDSFKDRDQLHTAIEKAGDTSNDTKFLISWLAGLVKQSNATEMKQQHALQFHINMTSDNAEDLEAIKNALNISTP